MDTNKLIDEVTKFMVGFGFLITFGALAVLFREVNADAVYGFAGFAVVMSIALTYQAIVWAVGFVKWAGKAIKYSTIALVYITVVFVPVNAVLLATATTIV